MDDTTPQGEDIKVKYTEGSVELEQVWRHIAHDGVQTNWKTSAEFPSRLNVDVTTIKNIYDMFPRRLASVRRAARRCPEARAPMLCVKPNEPTTV